MINIIPIESLPLFPEPIVLSYSISFGGFCKPYIDGPNDFDWERGQLFYRIYRDLQEEYAVPLFIDDPENLDEYGFPESKINPEYKKYRRSVVPPLDLWNDVWKICDEIDVWSWLPDMDWVQMTDTAEWHINLSVGSRSVHTKGYWKDVWYNKKLIFPRDLQSKVLRFHRALQALTGWQDTGNNSSS